MRNNSLDILKFVCAVAIVFLHANTSLKGYYLPLTRFAVPCFFIISGYFLMGKDMDTRMSKGVRRILKITTYSSVLYAVVSFVRHRFEITSIIPSAKELAAFVLLNDNPWGFHLWYLTAYLYTLLICIYLYRSGKLNVAFYFVPLLLVVDLVLGKYSLLILNMEFPFILVRNFLFVGLPYFLIGTYIRQHEKTFLCQKELILGGGNSVCIHYDSRKQIAGTS